MEESTKVVLFNTLNSAGNSLFFTFVFYHLALTGASTNNCAYCCCDGSRSTCKSPVDHGVGQGWRKSIADVFRILIGMRMFDYFVIFMLFLWNFYHMEGGFVWDSLFLPAVVSFLAMTLSYCLVVVSRKRRNDILNNKRHCCRCHDHGHQLPAATAGAAANDEEKQELLMNTSSDICGCCCCSGESEAGNSTDGGQSNCKLFGAGADQDPKIKLITKRFRMIAGITIFVHFGIFMMYLWAISFISSTS